jgi:hypothetical protein
MTEPTIIRSDTPHEVVIPEGSHDARSRSGHVGKAAKAITVEEEDSNFVVPSQQEHRVFVTEPPPADPLKDTVLKAPSEPRPAAVQSAPAEENLATTKVQPVLAKPIVLQEEMPEMDFPARIINIKIENDKVRASLDELELKLIKPQ